jgi:hypothetical protein
MKRRLQTADLLQALELFGDRYHAVDVFADDLDPKSHADVEQGIVRHAGKTYRYSVLEEHGVVRLARDSASPVATGAAAGAALGLAAAAAAKAKGGELLGGAVLGLLVGGVIGAASETSQPPRRVFAMQFDRQTQRWKAYDGMLLRWMKERLLTSQDAFGTPSHDS